MRFKKNFRKNMQLFKLKYIRKTKIISKGIFKKKCNSYVNQKKKIKAKKLSIFIMRNIFFYKFFILFYLIHYISLINR